MQRSQYPSHHVIDATNNLSYGHNDESTLIQQLATLSQQKRWLIWIAPPKAPSVQALQAMGIDTQHILMIHAKQITNRLDTFQKALASNTCSAVLAWFDHPAEAYDANLVAARQGDCLGIAFHQGLAAWH